ncbi:hypothetical protein NHX12_022499 [Muraenolepis orangiensis]|uniref:Uncharacterized protein n=1 Tax=Muraenolepis orangiensis TaxID=630683 RepID=A0A9Q0IRB7_9TELE|nr:hypothetical protein NHX12_022499 [Muraenolepis orangiensis]
MSESPDTRSLVSASSSSQLNLMDIDAIDDKEFDIPQVDTPPTLESILNEPETEEETFMWEDTSLLNTENVDSHSCETSSLASSDSGDPAHLKRRYLESSQWGPPMDWPWCLVSGVRHNTLT